MALLAQLRPAWEGANAQFRAAWLDASATISVVTDVDAGNIDPALVTIDNTDPSAPIIWLDYRAATGSDGWRHFLFAVENAEGKRPIFRMNRATMSGPTIAPAADSLPNLTTDFTTYTLAPTRTLIGGSTGYIEWQFTDPLPSGRVYVMDRPIGRQADAVTLASDLLTNYASVVTPSASANASGVFATSPAETDDLGRQVGSNPMYALKFAWGGSTTDGGPKRKLVVFAGIHSAGENASFIPFRRFLYWALNDSSQAAQNLRANWDIYAYFNLTPNGIKGGHRRWNFRSSQDPNRDFKLSGASVLAEITSARTVSTADVGTCDAFFSWHGYSTQTTAFIPGKNDQNSPTASSAVATFISIGEGIFGASALAYDSDGLANTDAWWAEAVLGAKAAFHAEIPQRGTSTLAYYETIGENWAKTLEATDAQGVFYSAAASASGDVAPIALSAPAGDATGATVGEGSASGVVASVALTAPAGTATATASASASGAAPIVVLSAPAGTATGTTAGAANASGVAPSLSLTAPTGTASSTSAANGSASGLMPTITLTAPTVAPPFVIPAARRRWTNLNGQSRPRYLN